MQTSTQRTPKLQLNAEQLLTGDCWISPKKDTPHRREKEKPQEDSRRGKITFRIKPHTHQRCSEGSNKPVCTRTPRPPPPPETEPELCLSVSRGGTGQQWPDAGAGALGAADLDVTQAFLDEVAVNPP